MKTNVELLREFERVIVTSVHEENYRKNGTTKRTAKEFERLQNEILKRMREE